MRVFLLRMRISRALVLGGVCIALVLLSGMIQAAHFHGLAGADHDCALCLAVHTVAQVAPPLVLPFTSHSVRAALPLPSIHVPRRSVYFRLASRPPPTTASLA